MTDLSKKDEEKRKEAFDKLKASKPKSETGVLHVSTSTEIQTVLEGVSDDVVVVLVFTSAHSRKSWQVMPSVVALTEDYPQTVFLLVDCTASDGAGGKVHRTILDLPPKMFPSGLF